MPAESMTFIVDATPTDDGGLQLSVREKGEPIPSLLTGAQEDTHAMAALVGEIVGIRVTRMAIRVRASLASVRLQAAGKQPRRRTKKKATKKARTRK